MTIHILGEEKLALMLLANPRVVNSGAADSNCSVSLTTRAVFGSFVPRQHAYAPESFVRSSRGVLGLLALARNE